MIRWHVISAVLWRNVKQYFSSVLGYLFIVAFVTICAVITFNPQFFAENLANLDQLSRWFPVLLLFFVPAITMTVWADEKKQGTDAILFTLPASDLEILLGKYFATCAVFTIALLFSLTQLVALRLIGEPDWGIVLATYIGYWLCGMSLLAIGMFASSLTDSPTVAFVVGTVLCAIPVLVGIYFRGSIWLERLGIDWNLQDFCDGLIPLANLLFFATIAVFMLYLNLVMISRRHWSRGRGTSLAIHYSLRAICLGIALVCLNYIAISYSSGDWTRVDLTAEKLFTLDDETLATLENAKSKKRPVTIQAFISEEVPRKFVNVKKQFVGLLRQFDYYGGNYVNVRYVNVRPNSQQEKEARKTGIQAIDDRSAVGGRTVEQKVYLGAHISSTFDDTVIASVKPNASIEYELTRSIAATTTESKKLRLGIVDTDLRFACEAPTGEQFPGWTFSDTMDHLRSQFDIVFIPQNDFPSFVTDFDSFGVERRIYGTLRNFAFKVVNPHCILFDPFLRPTNSVDVLLVADPASLSQQNNDLLIRYIKHGTVVFDEQEFRRKSNPTILLADPMPFYLTYEYPILGLLNAPRMIRVNPQIPQSFLLTSDPSPKADGGTCRSLFQSLNLIWNNGNISWNLENPHPNYSMPFPDELGNRWPEDFFGRYDHCVNFVRSVGEHEAFDVVSPITSNLRELLFIYPGSLVKHPGTDWLDLSLTGILTQPSSSLQLSALSSLRTALRQGGKSELTFTPLVSLSKQSGSTDWEKATHTPSQKMTVVNQRTGELSERENPARSPLTRELLIVPNSEASDEMGGYEQVVAAHLHGKESNLADVVVVADTDFLSQMIYDQEPLLNQSLDNYVFLANAIELLGGKKELVELRNRRPTLRTLSGFEKQIEQFKSLRARRTAEIKAVIETQRLSAESELTEAESKIKEDESKGIIQQKQMFAQERTDNRLKLQRKIDQLNDRLEAQVAELRNEETRQTNALENRIRWLSVLLAPLPAFVLGIFVLSFRAYQERRSIDPRRRVTAKMLNEGNPNG